MLNKSTLRRGLKSWAAAIVLVSFVFSCTVQKSPVTGKKRAYGYSWQEEVEIGNEADKSIQQQYGIYADSSVNQYVKRVGHRVLRESHMRRASTPEKYQETKFTFRVLDSPVVNAFALPGGYVYVTRGLLAHLNNEAQLAVVLGHEIGHVAARHASQRAFEQKAGQIALVGGAVVGQEVLGLPGQNLLELGGTATQLLFLRYSRDDERESDRLGVEYAAMAGYEASEGAEFFTSLRRLSGESEEQLPSLLSTHPDPGDREQKIPELAENWRKKGYEMSTVDKEQYFDILDQIVFGENPREGFTQNDFFYHPDLEFQFPIPDEWALINQRSSVILVSSEENAVMQLTIDSESNSAETAIADFLERDGIQTVSRGEASNEGDLPAYSATATAKTNDGAVKLYLYAVEHQGAIYRYLGYTSLDSYDQYMPAFEKASVRFRPLSDPEILAVNPVRLNIEKASKGADFHSLLPDKLPMNIEAEKMAIVNQLQLDTQIEQGTLLKFPVQ